MVTIAASIVRQLWRARISSRPGGVCTAGGSGGTPMSASLQHALAAGLIALTTFTISPIAAAQAAAPSVEGLLEWHADFVDIYREYTFPPPEQLIEPDRLTAFRGLIAKGDCFMAQLELANGFAHAYPQAPHPMKGDGDLAWREYVVPTHYPDIAFCVAKERVTRFQAEIEAKGLKVPPLPQHSSRDDRSNEEIEFTSARRRDMAIVRLIFIAENDHAPAQAELVRLSEAGRNIRLTPAYAYFLIERAKAQGFDAPDLATLAAAAAARLSQEAREALSPMIEAGTWPRGWPMVRD